MKFYYVFIALVVAAAAAGIGIVEFDKSQLRRQISQLSQNETALVRFRTESVRNRALIERFKASSAEGARAMHGDLVAARTELAALEAKAGQLPADASATPSIDANRDPTKAMTRPEFLSNVGRATPEAAFQTLIWGAMKGRDPEMAACLVLDRAARAKAESFLAGMPADVRAKYGTPEQLVGLAFSQGVLDATAFQFVVNSSGADNGDQVTLTVRTRSNGRETETKIPMVRSGDGWAMAVGERQIDVIRAGLTSKPPTP